MADRKPPNIRDLGTGFLSGRPSTSAVEVDGLTELRKALKAFGESTADLKAANLEAAEVVADTAELLAPRRSGALAESIRAAGQERWGVVRAGRRGSTPYAAPIHFGWGTRPNPAKGWRGGPIAPNPFLYDALDARRSEVIRTYEKNLAALVAKHDL